MPLRPSRRGDRSSPVSRQSYSKPKDTREGPETSAKLNTPPLASALPNSESSARRGQTQAEYPRACFANRALSTSLGGVVQAGPSRASADRQEIRSLRRLPQKATIPSFSPPASVIYFAIGQSLQSLPHSPNQRFFRARKFRTCQRSVASLSSPEVTAYPAPRHDRAKKQRKIQPASSCR